MGGEAARCLRRFGDWESGWKIVVGRGSREGSGSIGKGSNRFGEEKETRGGVTCDTRRSGM